MMTEAFCRTIQGRLCMMGYPLIANISGPCSVQRTPSPRVSCGGRERSADVGTANDRCAVCNQKEKGRTDQCRLRADGPGHNRWIRSEVSEHPRQRISRKSTVTAAFEKKEGADQAE